MIPYHRWVCIVLPVLALNFTAFWFIVHSHHICNLKYQKFMFQIGRVWWNTMFACPEFCGGYYQHGDEAYPYPKGIPWRIITCFDRSIISY